MRLRGEKGDTIIEVLFAVTVFAMVAVGSMAIMNQGTAAAQRALEITLVRQQIDSQAQAIRYIHQVYIASYQKDGPPATGVAAEWPKITNKTTGKGANSASEFGVTLDTACPNTVPGEKPFLVNARTALLWSGVPSMSAPVSGSLPPYAQIIYNPDLSINSAYGLWVEAVPSTTTNGPGFVDFHIRACWDSAGSSRPVTLGTIVRLYEPR